MIWVFVVVFLFADLLLDIEVGLDVAQMGVSRRLALLNYRLVAAFLPALFA